MGRDRQVCSRPSTQQRMKVAWSKDGFDSLSLCVSVSRELRGEHIWSYFCAFIMQSENKFESKTIHTHKFVIKNIQIQNVELKSRGWDLRRTRLYWPILIGVTAWQHPLLINVRGSFEVCGEYRAGAKKINDVLVVLVHTKCNNFAKFVNIVHTGTEWNVHYCCLYCACLCYLLFVLWLAIHCVFHQPVKPKTNVHICGQ